MNHRSLPLSPAKWAWIVVLLLIIVDQTVKVWVKTHMTLGECIPVTPWFQIHFVENNGMAYGMTFFNKLFLSSLRIVIVAALICYIYRLIKRQARLRYILLLSVIVAGAVGNIIDCLFYGLIFTESTFYHIASFAPIGEGYASFLTGRVVDMLYFPLFHFTWPEWIPWVGGQPHTFFSPVFNLADAYISVSVVALILFCRADFEGKAKSDEQ